MMAFAPQRRNAEECPTDTLETAQPLQIGKAYGTGAIVFHSTMFVLVVIVGILGCCTMTGQSKHKGFGSTFMRC